MAYFSGTAANFATLKTAIENACVSQGWVLSNGILSRNGCYVQLSSASAQLMLQAGNGQNGSSLTDTPTVTNTSGAAFLKDTTGVPIGWPVSFEIHVFTEPDEVYCVVNFNSDFYMQLSFGQSDVPGIGGTGNWFTGSFSPNVYSYSRDAHAYLDVVTLHWGFVTYKTFVGGLFTEKALSTSASHLHCGLDNVGWIGASNENTLSDGRYAQQWSAPLVARSPSPFNSASILIPIKCVKPRPSKGMTVVADLRNARIVRIDNLTPGGVIDYGSERWKVYPFLRKNADVRNGVPWPTGAHHSGTLGYAIKYTGA